MKGYFGILANGLLFVNDKKINDKNKGKWKEIFYDSFRL